MMPHPINTKEEKMPKSMLSRRIAPMTAIACALFATASIAQEAPKAATPQTSAKPDAAPNMGVSIWTKDVTGFRKISGAKGGYTKKFDLSDLPRYTPKTKLTGKLRVWGNNYLRDGKLGAYWKEAFEKFHPGLQIEYNLPTGAVAVSALVTGVADVGMNYKATLNDRLTFEQMFGYPVTQITVVTGSYDVYGWGPPGIVAVHKDNPLEQLTMAQVDGVFGGERRGGYSGSVWHTEAPYSRGPEGNIRTWDQLGLKGKWAGKKIGVCGQNLTAGAVLQFSDKVLMGSLQFVEGYQAFTNYMKTDGTMNTWSSQVKGYMDAHPMSICTVSPLTLQQAPDMKEIAIQGRKGGPFVKRTLETVRDNSYPLTHHGFFFINKKPGQSADPRVEEFVRFVLSQEGQDEVQREGRYLPLTGAMVQRELKKLD